MEIGIRELKAKLSHYVQEASNGRAITVTDRGKPVARLVALSHDGSQLQQGIDEGWIEPPRRRSLTPPPQYEAALSTAAVLEEDRG